MKTESFCKLTRLIRLKNHSYYGFFNENMNFIITIGYRYQQTNENEQYKV